MPFILKYGKMVKHALFYSTGLKMYNMWVYFIGKLEMGKIKCEQTKKKVAGLEVVKIIIAIIVIKKSFSKLAAKKVV